MKISRAALAVVGASALLVGTMAGPALADTDVPLYGGTTTITTTAKSLPTITKAGIVMTGTDGATSAYIRTTDQTRQEFGFKIGTPSNLMLEDDATGPEGSITGGKIVHSGSIELVNTNNGKAVEVGDFTVNFNKMKVFANLLNGDPIDPALAVFKLVPVETPLYPEYEEVTPPAEPTFATVSGVKVQMTGKAADALNSSLGTKVFEGGLKFGKAVAVAELVAPV